jgi:hypothetical protein
VKVIVIFPAGLEMRNFDISVSVVQGAVFKAAFHNFGKIENDFLWYFTLKLYQNMCS